MRMIPDEGTVVKLRVVIGNQIDYLPWNESTLIGVTHEYVTVTGPGLHKWETPTYGRRVTFKLVQEVRR